MIQVTMSVDARADLLDFLEAHKADIDAKENDFGSLRAVFDELILGIPKTMPPPPKSSDERMIDDINSVTARMSKTESADEPLSEAA